MAFRSGWQCHWDSQADAVSGRKTAGRSLGVEEDRQTRWGMVLLIFSGFAADCLSGSQLTPFQLYLNAVSTSRLRSV